MNNMDAMNMNQMMNNFMPNTQFPPYQPSNINFSNIGNMNNINTMPDMKLNQTNNFNNVQHAMLMQNMMM